MFGDFAIESFYLFGSFQGIVIVSLLMIKSRTKANIILAILIGLLSLFLFEQVLFLSQGIRKYPHILYSTLPITFLIGPVIYHFVRINTGSDHNWKWIYFIHLIPFFYEVAILTPFYILPAETKISIYEYVIQDRGDFNFNRFSFGYLLYTASTLYFLISSFGMLRGVSSQKNKDRRKKKLLMQIVGVMAVYLGLNLLLFIATFMLPEIDMDVQRVIPLILAILIHILGFICFLNPDEIILIENSNRYVNSGLSGLEVEKLGLSLVSVLKEKQMYLNHELKPRELADELGISTTNLSRVISEGLNTSFYELVNEHRVNKAKDLLASNDYSDSKLLHIALDSGFSNKSSFIRNFKRFVGMNPTDFRKKGYHSNEWNLGN